MHLLFRPILPLALVFQAGCSIFIGNVRPVEERTNQWSAPNLAKESKNWKLLSSNPSSPDQELSDVAYQSLKTGAVISLNSACRTSGVVRQADLRDLKRQLLLGVTGLTTLSEAETQLDGSRGLRSEVSGKLSERDVRMMTVIAQRSNCIFDLMYVARPEQFASEIEVFERFLERVRLN